MPDSKEDRIRARAHAIWLNEGQPAGHEARHWQQASDDVDAEDGKAAKTPAARKRAVAKPRVPEASGAGAAIAKTSKDAAKKPPKKP